MGIPDMIAQIDAEIIALEARIAKLKDARETIVSLEGPVTQGGYHSFPLSFEKEPETTPDQSLEQSPRNATSKPRPQAPRRSSAGREFVAGLIEKPVSAKDQIIAAIGEAGRPLTSAEIRDIVGAGVRKQTIWAALSDLVKNGVLNRSDDGKYTFISKD